MISNTWSGYFCAPTQLRKRQRDCTRELPPSPVPAPLRGNFAFLTSGSERARGQVTVALSPWLSALLPLLEPLWNAVPPHSLRTMRNTRRSRVGGGGSDGPWSGNKILDLEVLLRRGRGRETLVWLYFPSPGNWVNVAKRRKGEEQEAEGNRGGK